MKYSAAILFALVLSAASVCKAGDAKETWEKTCAKCHGVAGKGDTKMGKKLDIKDLTDAKIQAALTDEKAFTTIKHGVKEGDKTKMKAAENLSDADIKALVELVRSLKK